MSERKERRDAQRARMKMLWFTRNEAYKVLADRHPEEFAEIRAKIMEEQGGLPILPAGRPAGGSRPEHREE